MTIKTVSELEARIAECTARLEEKFTGKSGKRYVMLCGGTGCVAANSMGIRDRFEQLIAERGLSGSVEVRTVGCFGLCSQGPFVSSGPRTSRR